MGGRGYSTRENKQDSHTKKKRQKNSSKREKGDWGGSKVGISEETKPMNSRKKMKATTENGKRGI